MAVDLNDPPSMATPPLDPVPDRQNGASSRSIAAIRQVAFDPSALLIEALDALPIAITIYDQEDRQVIRNRHTDAMFPGAFDGAPMGMSFEEVMRRVLDLGLMVAPPIERELWIQQRLAQRMNADPDQPVVQQLKGDRWIHTYEVRTPHGFTVTARVDVTEQIRKERLLAEANDRLERQSTTDGLTGVANRRKFDEALDSEWHRAARAGTSLSLLMVDIDHFKRYNDRYGHIAGDECLRKVANLLASSVRRAGELLARYGGEEFVLLLPGADRELARQTAQRCLDRLAHLALPHASAPSGVVSVSIGVAQVFPQADDEPESLVNAADAAMYRAKMAGRACYVLADDSDWSIDKDAPRSRWSDVE